MPKYKRQAGQRPTKEEQAKLLREIGEPDDRVKAKQIPGFGLSDFLDALTKVVDADEGQAAV